MSFYCSGLSEHCDQIHRLSHRAVELSSILKDILDERDDLVDSFVALLQRLLSVEGFREVARVVFQDTNVARHVINAIAFYDDHQHPRTLDLNAPLASAELPAALASLDTERAALHARLETHAQEMVARSALANSETAPLTDAPADASMSDDFLEEKDIDDATGSALPLDLDHDDQAMSSL